MKVVHHLRNAPQVPATTCEFKFLFSSKYKCPYSVHDIPVVFHTNQTMTKSYLLFLDGDFDLWLSLFVEYVVRKFVIRVVLRHLFNPMLVLVYVLRLLRTRKEYLVALDNYFVSIRKAKVKKAILISPSREGLDNPRTFFNASSNVFIVYKFLYLLVNLLVLQASCLQSQRLVLLSVQL